MYANVRGADLKSVFIDLTALFKGYDRAKVFSISTRKNSIVFTADTGIYYTREIDMTPGPESVNMDMTVLFADVAHFIPAKSDITLDITEFYITVTAPKTTINLQIGESIVAPYQPRKGRLVDLDYGVIRQAAKIFTSTQDLQKAFGRDFAVTMYGDWALMRTPTLWIRTKSQGLNCVLSMEQLKSIVTFQPEYVEESDRLEFHKGRAILSIPMMKPTESDKFPELKAGLNKVATFTLKGIVKELLEVKRAIGVSECDIHIHQDGFHIKISKGGVSLEESYNAYGASVYSFKYMLDIFIMCLNLLGEENEVTIYTKGEVICLETQDTSIIMSV